MKPSYKLPIFDFKLTKDVYETQDFSEVTKLNNITQPAVSRRVKEISNNLCEVFLHKNKKIVLTSERKEIYHFINQTLFACNDLLDKLTLDFEQTTAFGSDTSYPKAFLSIIRKNLPGHHKLNVRVYSNSRSIPEVLLNDQIDLGIISDSYTQKGVLKIQLRTDKLTTAGQKELIEAFDNGQETLFLLYHMTSSYYSFLKESIKINQLPTQYHLSIDNSLLVEREVLSGTRITIVNQDTTDHMLTNDNIAISPQKSGDIFIKTYATIEVDNTYCRDLIPITQKLKK